MTFKLFLDLPTRKQPDTGFSLPAFSHNLEGGQDLVLLVDHDHLCLSVLVWSHKLTVVARRDVARFIPTLIVMPSHKDTTGYRIHKDAGSCSSLLLLLLKRLAKVLFSKYLISLMPFRPCPEPRTCCCSQEECCPLYPSPHCNTFPQAHDKSSRCCP